MKKIEIAVAAALAGVVMPIAVAQDAVQWRVEDGGNGHWYDIIVNDQTWQQCREAAHAFGADLASVASESENQIVEDLMDEAAAVAGDYRTYWLGGSSETGQAEDWAWSDGSPWSFERWCSFAPNNGSGGFLVYAPKISCWDDYSDGNAGTNTRGALIEWSADCNADGIVDYGQILDGSLPDDDENGVPDCCDFSLPCGVAIEGHDWQIEPIEWKEEDGGNGHWYGRMCFNSGCSSSDGFYGFWVRDAYVLSKGGHLATMNSPEEQDFLRSNTLGGSFGGFQDRTAADYSEPNGGWRWVTGEPFDYTGWGPGEPNNFGGNEHYVFTCCGGEAGNWNDGATLAVESVVEFSADCNEDGIVDYGQILDGTYPDKNGNGVPDCCDEGVGCDCPADITGDGQVDAADLGVLLAVWNTDGGAIPAADINGDGTVNASDLGLLLGSWGLCS